MGAQTVIEGSEVIDSFQSQDNMIREEENATVFSRVNGALKIHKNGNSDVILEVQ